MTNDEGNVVKISPFSHIQLLLAILKGGNVASYLFGKPPNPRRGTSWKRRQTSAFTHTPLSQCTYPAIAGYFGEGEGSDRKVKKRRIARGEW